MILRRRTATFGLIALAMGGVCLSGCATSPPRLTDASGQHGYALGPGDKVHIIVYNDTQLTGDYVITPSGNISLPLIGNISTNNKSTEDLQAAISSELGNGYIKDAKVSVDILTYRDYYILGEVNKPGEYPYAAGLDVQQAVAAAGGFTYRANKRMIFVRRSRSVEKSVDLHESPVSVMPGDTIRVGQRYF